MKKIAGLFIITLSISTLSFAQNVVQQQTLRQFNDMVTKTIQEPDALGVRTPHSEIDEEMILLLQMLEQDPELFRNELQANPEVARKMAASMDRLKIEIDSLKIKK